MGKIQIGRWAPTLSTKMTLGHSNTPIAPASITFVGAGSAGTTPSIPAGAVGDILILSCVALSIAVSSPAGWTPIVATSGGGGAAFWWRRATGSDALSALPLGVGRVYRFAGCVAGGSPIASAVDNQQFDITFTYGALSVTAPAGGMVVAAVSTIINPDADTTFGAANIGAGPTFATSIGGVTQNDSSAGQYMAIGLWYAISSGGGSISSTPATVNLTLGDPASAQTDWSLFVLTPA